MKYIKEFDGLRGILALWVLVGHCASATPIFKTPFTEAFYNQKAVTVFIILSGFAIAAMIDQKGDSYGTYLLRRILRIFPVYLLFLAISVAVAPLALQVWQAAPPAPFTPARIEIATDTLAYWPAHLAAHLVALHGLVPPALLPSTDYAFLGQAWSISLEWQFYLIAPAMIPLVLGHWPRAIAGKAAILAALAIVAFVITRMPDGFIGKSLPDFVIGILSYHVLKVVERGQIADTAIAAGALLLIAVTIVTLRAGSLPYLVWAIAFGAVALRRRTESPAARTVSGLLLWRPLQWIGRMAYSMYLSHMIVLLFGLMILERVHITSPIPFGAILLAFVLLGTLIVSTLSYNLVEMPFHRLGRNLRAPAAGPLAAAPSGG